MPCAKGLPVRQNDRAGSGCRAACLHRAMVTEYRAARQADIEAAESATGLYPAELAEYRETHPALTFKDWLGGRRT